MKLFKLPAHRPHPMYLFLFFGWVILSGYMIFQYFQYAFIWNANDELPHSLNYIYHVFAKLICLLCGLVFISIIYRVFLLICNSPVKLFRLE